MKRDKAWDWQRGDASALNLTDKRVAVIGGTGGIGRALSRLLASKGAEVTVVGQTFRDAGVPRIQFVPANLELMREAERIGKSLPAEDLDMAILTTGIFAAKRRQVTGEGIERDMAVSFLSRLVIARAIAPKLGKNRPRTGVKPRIFVWGYPGTGRAGTLGDLNSEKSYSMWRAHMNTVAGNEALVYDSARRFPEVESFGMSPGVLATNIRSNMRDPPSNRGFMEWMIAKTSPSPDEYAERIAPLLFSPDLGGHSGAIFDRKGNPSLPSLKLSDPTYAQAFLAESETLVTRALHAGHP